MKAKYKIIYTAMLGILMSAGILSSCKDDAAMELPYLFRPINFEVELNKTVATLTWAHVDSAASYTLQLSQDSLFTSLVVDTTLTGQTLVQELAGETKFFARVRANAQDTIKNSKFNSTLSFSTPKENIFLGYGTSNNTGALYSAYMTGVNTLTVKWTPSSNVSHLILTSADGSLKDSVALSAAEIAAGSKVISSLENSNWRVRIYNHAILRGTTYGMVEGDIVVANSSDLVAALNNATAGQVVLLEPGIVYTVGNSAYNFTKNLKVRCASPTNRAVVCMTAGTPTTTSNMLSITSTTPMDSLVFENINFTGYCDNNTASTKIGYLFNNKTTCSINSIKFLNCGMNNFGNTPFRLQGGLATISNLVFNGCVVSDYGYASGYGMINISKTNDKIDNIKIMNSTIYNFSYPVISIVQSVLAQQTSMSSVVVSNCTFNQATQNIASSRVLFNFDYVNITGGFTLSKCVFGSSGAKTAGFKATNAGTTVGKTVSGCYYTTDFVDETTVADISYSLKSLMTSYSGTSASLWTSPTTGDFTLKDTNFAGKGTAGDLRWY